MLTALVTVLTGVWVAVGPASAVVQDPGLEELLIVPGEVVGGVLEGGDHVMTSDDTYFDVYILPVVSGHTYRISMDFDAYLILSDFVTGETADDDDSGSGTNSMLTLTAEGDGFFVLKANSLNKNTGTYTLSVVELVLRH